MYYVYILLLDEIPIYAGRTNNPVSRFRRHYLANDCGTYNVLRYYLFKENKLVKMKLVYCCNNENECWDMEWKAIRALGIAGFNIINNGWKGSFPKLEERIKTPHGIFTTKSMQYIKDNQNEILKEYGYK